MSKLWWGRQSIDEFGHWRRAHNGEINYLNIDMYFFDSPRPLSNFSLSLFELSSLKACFQEEARAWEEVHDDSV